MYLYAANISFFSYIKNIILKKNNTNFIKIKYFHVHQKLT